MNRFRKKSTDAQQQQQQQYRKGFLIRSTSATASANSASSDTPQQQQQTAPSPYPHPRQTQPPYSPHPASAPPAQVQFSPPPVPAWSTSTDRDSDTYTYTPAPPPALLPDLTDTNDFRTSIILPDLAHRFSLLRAPIDSVKSRLADQRARQSQSALRTELTSTFEETITEEEEGMILETLGRFTRKFGVGSGNTTTDAVDQSQTQGQPTSTSASASTSPPSSPTPRSLKRYSNTMFGSGRLRDLNQMRGAGANGAGGGGENGSKASLKGSVRSVSGTLTDGTVTAKQSPASAVEVDSDPPVASSSSPGERGEYSFIVPDPTTAGGTVSLSEPKEELEEDDMELVEAERRRLERAMGPTAFKRASRAVDLVLRELEQEQQQQQQQQQDQTQTSVVADEHEHDDSSEPMEEEILVPRTGTSMGIHTASASFAAIQGESPTTLTPTTTNYDSTMAMAVSTDHQHSFIARSDDEDRVDEDNGDDTSPTSSMPAHLRSQSFVFGHHLPPARPHTPTHTYSQSASGAAMMNPPQTPQSTSSFSTSALSRASPIPARSVPVPGYVPGMPRPMTPRNFDIEDLRSSSTTPRATSPPAQSSSTAAARRESLSSKTPLFLSRSPGRYTPVPVQDVFSSSVSSDYEDSGFSSVSSSPTQSRRRPASPLSGPAFQPLGITRSPSRNSSSRPSTPSNIVWMAPGAENGSGRESTTSPSRSVGGRHSRNNSWIGNGVGEGSVTLAELQMAYGQQQLHQRSPSRTGGAGLRPSADLSSSFSAGSSSAHVSSLISTSSSTSSISAASSSHSTASTSSSSVSASSSQTHVTATASNPLSLPLSHSPFSSVPNLGVMNTGLAGGQGQALVGQMGPDVGSGVGALGQAASTQGAGIYTLPSPTTTADGAPSPLSPQFTFPQQHRSGTPTQTQNGAQAQGYGHYGGYSGSGGYYAPGGYGSLSQRSPVSPAFPGVMASGGGLTNGSRRSSRQTPVGSIGGGPGLGLGPGVFGLGSLPIANSSRSSLDSAGSSFHSWDEPDRVLGVFSETDVAVAWHEFGESVRGDEDPIVNGNASGHAMIDDAEDTLLQYAGLRQSDIQAIQEKLVMAALVKAANTDPRDRAPSALRRRRPSTSQSNYSRIASPPPQSQSPPFGQADDHYTKATSLLNSVVQSIGPHPSSSPSGTVNGPPPPPPAINPHVPHTPLDNGELTPNTRKARDLAHVLGFTGDDDDEMSADTKTGGHKVERDEDEEDSVGLPSSSDFGTGSSSSAPGSIPAATATTPTAAAMLFEDIKTPTQSSMSAPTAPSTIPTTSTTSAPSSPSPYMLQRNPSKHRLPPSTPQERAELVREVARQTEAATLALKSHAHSASRADLVTADPATGGQAAAPTDAKTGAGAGLKPSLSIRKKIDTSQISNPRLVSASTSVDTIPLRSPSAAGSVGGGNGAATPTGGSSKFGSRFKKLRGSLRVKGLGGAEDPSHVSSSTDTTPVQTRQQPTHGGHMRGESDPAQVPEGGLTTSTGISMAATGQGSDSTMTLTPSSSTTSGTPPASAGLGTPPLSGRFKAPGVGGAHGHSQSTSSVGGPGLKGFMARFRNKQRMGEVSPLGTGNGAVNAGGNGGSRERLVSTSASSTSSAAASVSASAPSTPTIAPTTPRQDSGRNSVDRPLTPRSRGMYSRFPPANRPVTPTSPGGNGSITTGNGRASPSTSARQSPTPRSGTTGLAPPSTSSSSPGHPGVRASVDPQSVAAMEQLFAAGQRLGLDQSVLSDLLARSKSTNAGSKGGLSRSHSTAATVKAASSTEGESFGPLAMSVAGSAGSDQTATPSTYQQQGEESMSRRSSMRQGAPQRRPPKDGATGGDAVVRRTLIFANDGMSVADLNAIMHRKTSQRRKRASAQSVSSRSVHDRAPTPPPNKVPAVKRFSTDMPPVPQLPGTHGGVATGPGGSIEKSSSTHDSFYDMYAEESRAASSLAMADLQFPSDLQGMPSSENGAALEVIQLASGELIWNVVNGLRDYDDESVHTGRTSFASEYSTRESGPDGGHHHTRSGSKASAGSISSKKKAQQGRLRPETKVHHIPSAEIARFIEAVSQGADAGSFSFAPSARPGHSASSSVSTGEGQWTVEERLDRMLGAMNGA